MALQLQRVPLELRLTAIDERAPELLALVQWQLQTANDACRPKGGRLVRHQHLNAGFV